MLKKIFLKKKKRKRQIPTLQERELQREQEREKEREQQRGTDKPEEQKKTKGKVVPFRSPNAPAVLESKDTRYTVLRESIRNFPWIRLVVTFSIILIGGVGSAAFQARNTNLRRDITRAERRVQELQTENFRLEQQLQERYTFYEIERIATDRLGMSHPDPSQIVNINVPRVGGVTLNTADYALPQHNYFWSDISDFFSRLINNIFSGN